MLVGWDTAPGEKAPFSIIAFNLMLGEGDYLSSLAE
jgi:hypothetical protein